MSSIVVSYRSVASEKYLSSPFFQRHKNINHDDTMTAVTTKQLQLHHGMFYKIITLHSVWIGFIIRLFIAWFLPWMMDQNPLLGVDYTDIDLYVRVTYIETK